MWGAHEAMGWWMLFGSVLWLLFIAAVLYAFTGMFDRGPGAPEGRPEPALDIAKRRFAAGEISRQEYELLRDALLR